MKRFLQWVDRNHIAIVFALAVSVATSVYMYLDLPKDVFPSANFPRFQVIADIGFASLEDTEIHVTRPIEEAVKTVPDVKEVRSVTERGTSTIDIYLRWGTDLDRAYQYVQSRVDQTRGLLPPNADINVIRMSTSAFPMSEYGFWSDSFDLKELYTVVRYTVIPKLIGIDGIYGLSVIGGEEPEIRVQLDSGKLTQYNLDAAGVGAAINEANKVSFIGNVIQGKSAFFTVGGEKLTDIPRIAETVVATRMGRPVYLKEVATVQDSHAEVRRIVSVNGHKGLFIDVQKQQNADGLKVSGQLDERMAEIGKEYGPRLHITKWDLSDFVASSIHGILFDISVGIVVILLIVYSILRKFRYSLPVILILPIVIALEFLVLKVLGLTVNIMTLGGLSAAIGIVADNAIVVTENFVRFKARGESHPLSSSMAYIVPITVWATSASIIVFIPLAILSGTSGLFFKPLAATLATTIAVSLLMAVLVIPVLILYFIEGEKTHSTEDKEGRFLLVLKKGYLRILDLALRSKWIVVAVTVLLIILGAVSFRALHSGFLPEWDEGDIVLDYRAPEGTSLDGTDEIAHRVEMIIQNIPEVQTFIRKTGTHLGTPFAAPTVGEIILLLDRHKKRSTFQVMDELREAVSKEMPDLDTDFFQMLPDRLGDLAGTAKPITVNVVGNDFGKLWNTAETIKDRLGKIKGLSGVLIDMPAAQKEIKISANQASASLLGIGIQDVFHHSQLALYGEAVSNLQRGLQSIPIREFYAGGYRNDAEKMAEIPIFTPNGGILPLGKLAEFKTVEQYPEIHHKNGSLVVSVNAEISGRPLGDVVADVKTVLSDLKRDDFTIELAGSYKDQQTSFRELLFVLFISIVLILAILLFIFESYKTALAVFLGTICSATFVVFGLFLTGTEFDVSSFTGMITVMGIVVNNGILVIDFAERFRREGKDLTGSIREAGDLRFRPVLITNLAAMAGFLPMALNLGHGGEVLRPFSIAMISGLLGSMVFSLIFMPVFYDLWHRTNV